MFLVECIHDPRSYSREQIRFSLAFAEELSRGNFLLCVKPAYCRVCFGSPETFCCECGAS